MSDLDSAKAQLLKAIAREVHDPRVLDALTKLPREQFVPASHYDHAYDDTPLPIGAGQTISQPLIVAMMTEVLALTGEETVLEVGAGSGYQAAILGLLAKRVVTVERFADLAETAARHLEVVGAANVSVHVAGNVMGWPDDAPYDAVIVTAAAPRVPQALLDQLKDGGRMIIPVGNRELQDLLVVIKQGDGIRRRSRGPCRFVPLIGGEGWPED